MKILVFLHGTAIMHKAGLGVSREERVKQVIEKDPSVQDYSNYIPVGKIVEKLQKWINQGAEVIYLSSHETLEDVEKDKLVLDRYSFPKGEIFYRKDGKTYAEVIGQVLPDVLIEDDCESIGGENEMTYTNLEPEIKLKIKPIVVKEFDGIDNLPDDINQLI